MRANLESVKNEIEKYLEENNFTVFHGLSRQSDQLPIVEWDAQRYPNYKLFLQTARQLDERLIVLHHREFSAEAVDDLLDELDQFSLDDDSALSKRLRELRLYDGFTCAVELSFEHRGTIYLFELEADWYREFNELREEIESAVLAKNAEDDEEDDSLGGYYSKN